jgi:cholest-4-en-3-one 26-monooxygenase
MPLTSEETVDLAEVDLSDPDLFAGGPPHTLFERMRREAPVRWNPISDGPGFWAAVRHEDIAAISKDPETFSSWLGGTMISEKTLPLPVARKMMINMDPPQHTAYREIVSTAFTSRRVAHLEPHIREIARNLIDAALEKGDFDLVNDIALPLPIQVIGELLGVAPEDHGKLAEWAGASAGFDDPRLRPEGFDPQQSFIERTIYFNELAQDRIKEPRDDLVTALTQAELDGQRLTEEQLGGFLSLILVAGSDTTRNVYSGGMLAMIEHPDQWERLRADRELVPSAVEEFVRWVTPFTHFRRTATRDTEIRGVQVRSGDAVVTWFTSGNRDEDVFSEPFQFDVARENNRHQGFGGGGPHYCLGAGLARLELRVLIEETVDRVPQLELAGPPDRVRSALLNALHSLPVRPA